VQDPTSAGNSDNLQAPIGFPVSPKKFWLMSILTCTIYRFYWGYQNFRHLNVPANPKFKACVYAIFLPLSFHQLMKEVENGASQGGSKIKLRKVRLALSLLTLTIIARLLDILRLPIGAMFVGILALVPLYQAQKQINAINGELSPNLIPDNKFSPWDIVGMALGATYTIYCLVTVLSRHSQ
jgi:hypothetical protein